MKNFKLGTVLLVGGLLTVAVPLVVVGIVSVYESTESITSLMKQSSNMVAESLAHDLEDRLAKELRLTKNISFMNSVIAVTEKVNRDGEKKSAAEINAVQREIGRMKDDAGSRYSTILIVGKNRVAFVSADPSKKGVNLAGRDYLEKAFSGVANIGSVVFSRVTGSIILTAVAPVFSSTGKTVIGAVVLSIYLKYLTDIVDSSKIGAKGYCYLIGKNGVYITHPVVQNILKANISQTKGMESMWRLVSQGKSGTVEYTSSSGVQKIASVHPIAISGWGAVSSVPADELYAPAHATRDMIITIGIVFLILASLFFSFFARRITLPIKEVADAAGNIALGDLSVNISAARREDEIGSLARAFLKIVETLRERSRLAERVAGKDLTADVALLSEKDALGYSLRAMVEQLRDQIRAITEGVNILASSGSEIMASVSQLTSGAAQTATAVGETTATVEEVKQTAEVSSNKAKHVADLGQTAVEISKAGTKSIEDAVEGMNDIKAQMESIANTVVSLSEQNQAIGEIIAAVNDLAEQSSLLAVNASIEAAKAGEQGKGFAVVAQEIKSLAGQSKQATTQVRTILFDVQKAISSAVMATEQGRKAVSSGVKLSANAGEAIETLTGSVEEAMNAAIQIAASSKQQLVGMDQVVTAIENIRDAAIQAAASTKQTERTAHDLHDLGQRLQELVKEYRI